MKINSSVPNLVGAGQDVSRPRSPQVVGGRPDVRAGERVDISPLSSSLQEVGSSEMPVNAARVAEIKQAISEGRFQINPERIADGLLASVRDMLGRIEPAA